MSWFSAWTPKFVAQNNETVLSFVDVWICQVYKLCLLSKTWSRLRWARNPARCSEPRSLPCTLRRNCFEGINLWYRRVYIWVKSFVFYIPQAKATILLGSGFTNYFSVITNRIGAPSKSQISVLNEMHWTGKRSNVSDLKSDFRFSKDVLTIVVFTVAKI